MLHKAVVNSAAEVRENWAENPEDLYRKKPEKKAARRPPFKQSSF
jgi:hypothetical protein